jgi:hypothetical protein
MRDPFAKPASRMRAKHILGRRVRGDRAQSVAVRPSSAIEKVMPSVPVTAPTCHRRKMNEAANRSNHQVVMNIVVHNASLLQGQEAIRWEDGLRGKDALRGIEAIGWIRRINDATAGEIKTVIRLCELAWS